MRAFRFGSGCEKDYSQAVLSLRHFRAHGLDGSSSVLELPLCEAALVPGNRGPNLQLGFYLGFALTASTLGHSKWTFRGFSFEALGGNFEDYTKFDLRTAWV